MKRILLLTLVFILVTSILWVLQFRSQNENDKNELLAQVGDHRIYENSFRNKAGFLNSADQSDRNTSLFDAYIGTVLLAEYAKSLNLTSTTESATQEDWYYNNLKIKHYKKQHLKKYSISEKELNNLPLYVFKENVMLDYVRVPLSMREIAYEVKEFVDDPESSWISYLETPNAKEAKEKGVMFAFNKPLYECFFTEDDLKEIGLLEVKETTIFENENSFLVVKVLRRSKTMNPSELIKIKLAEQIALAKAIDNGDTLFNEQKLIKSISINKERLSSIQFDAQNLVSNRDSVDRKIVAEYKNVKITEQELFHLIQELPYDIKMLFNDVESRKRAIITLVMSYIMNEPFESERFPNKWKEKLKIQSSINVALENNGGKDTVSIARRWIKNYLQNKDTLTYDLSENALHQEVREDLKLYKKKVEKLTGNNKLFSWLHPHLFYGNINNLKIDYIAIESLSINDTDEVSIDPNVIVAFTDHWKLTLGELRDIIDNLSQVTQATIASEARSYDLIKYVAKAANVSNMNTLKVNENVLAKVKFKTLTEAPVIKETDTVASLGTEIYITIGELRKEVHAYRKVDPSFFNSNDKESDLQELLLKKFWLMNANASIVNNEEDLEKEVEDYEMRQLVEVLLEEALIDPLEVLDRSLNNTLGKIIREMNNKKIEGILNKSAEEVQIKIDEQVAISLGIDLNQSSYLRFIQKL